MSALQRFENRLEQMISGVFARTFRSAVQPVEIASALNREVDNSAQILSRDRRRNRSRIGPDTDRATWRRWRARSAVRAARLVSAAAQRRPREDVT